MILDILGTKYTLVEKNYMNDKSFKERNIYSYCDGYKKEIVICDPSTFPGWEDDDRITLLEYKNYMIRHEIVHAFLFESGLAQNSRSTDAWASSEEIVDWIARQGPKMYKIWEKAEEHPSHLSEFYRSQCDSL